YAGDDEQGHDQSGNAGQNGMSAALGAEGLTLGVPALLGADDVNQNQLGQTDEDSGNGTSHKEGAYGTAGDHGVNDHGGGRGNDHTHGGGGYGDTGSGIGRIALFFHGGDQDGTQSGGICYGGTGDTAENHGGNNVYLAQTAPDGTE